HDDLGYPVSTVEAAADYVDTVDLLGRTNQKFKGQCINVEPVHDEVGELAKFCSSHNPVMVVSLAGKIIQDAERFKHWVDLRHLFQTPDVRVPPSNR
nr:hypothetical protein [Tanacetum cinerariifolium]